MLKKTLLSMTLLACGLFSYTNAYLLGFKSFDNSIENILQIEEKYWVHFPIVSFIYDPRKRDHTPWELEKIAQLLGTERIYHLSISPNSFTAEQIAQGAFDKQYRNFFHIIKNLNLKVIFRTMHEMNGGRYPRSSNPQAFQQARIHIRNLAREIGLDQKNILFTMSVNARDLPTKDAVPHQRSLLLHCTQKNKKKLNCPTFEDYYPGDAYVDLMGFTFYNRWKGNSNRRRGNPDKIINTWPRNTLERIKKFNKPIFIDEVGTTAVNYSWSYHHQKSIQVYENNPHLKNQRIRELKNFLERENQILGAIYFNVDLTNGLQHEILGELDRALINLQNGKFYESFRELYNGASPFLSPILSLFWQDQILINNQLRIVPLDLKTTIKDIDTMLSKKYQTIEEKAEFYHGFTGYDENPQLFESIQILKTFYPKQEKPTF